MKYWIITTLLLLPLTAFSQQERPKLLVVIVIDQFRADYLTRFRKNFLPSEKSGKILGGFNYLLLKGAYFPFGQNNIAQNMTAPGHATVLTGSYPYQSGIPLNHWYNKEKESIEGPTDDETFPLVGINERSKTKGASPKNLVATTVGDELKNAGYPSKIISIAIKQPPAVLMGGHRADLALWYDSKSHQWISSQYYLPSLKLPKWILNLNTEMSTQQGQKIVWRPGNKNTGFSGSTDFRHELEVGKSDLNKSPYGLTITRKAAEHAIKALNLGKGSSTDVLAISFSSHDTVGHTFGPNSREMEEMTYAIDREIGTLLNSIQKSLPDGLKRTVLVLTGDHGVAPTPELALSHQYEAGHIDEKDLDSKISAHLDEKFGKLKKGNWISIAMSFNLYLNSKLIQEKGLKQPVVESEIKSFLKNDQRIAHIVTRTEIENRILPPGIHEKQILHSFYPKRSGDIILIFKPYYIPKALDGAPANHITGYSYDRTVPIVISGPGIKPKVYSTRAEVIDIAPTLSFLTGVIPPSLSEGRVLDEILEDKQVTFSSEQ
jgi:predicted AlkP superfamily pyrophosphatase or phosphodiesterase